MENLYCLVGNIDVQPVIGGQPVLLKITESVSAYLVFRDPENARAYALDNLKGATSEAYQVVLFTFAAFDKTRDWAEQSNIDLLIHLID